MQEKKTIDSLEIYTLTHKPPTLKFYKFEYCSWTEFSMDFSTILCELYILNPSGKSRQRTTLKNIVKIVRLFNYLCIDKLSCDMKIGAPT